MHLGKQCFTTGLKWRERKPNASKQKWRFTVIEITNAHFYQPGFIPLIQKLARVEGLPAKAAYRVGKIAQTVLRAYTVVDTKRLDVIGKHVKKDEAGQWVKAESGDLEFADKEAVTKEVDELLQAKVEIEQLPLELQTLDAAKLSPAELLMLDWMIKE